MSERLASKLFFKTLPAVVEPHISAELTIQSRQPFHSIIQFYEGDPRIHYEIYKPAYRTCLEVGLHFEAKAKKQNAMLLRHFDHRLFELKEILGDGLVAEPWDRGWAKVYELYPPEEWTTAYQSAVGKRMATFINTIHPYLREIM